MEGTNSRRSPAIIVAVLALVAALAGTAIAGSDATTSALTKEKVKKLVKKEVAKQIENATGPPGLPGAGGAAGADGAEVMLATLRDLAAAGQASVLYAPVGESVGAGGFHSGLAPSDFVATGLRVKLDDGVTGPNSSRAFILRVNNSDTALACTIVMGQDACSSDERVTVPAGSTVEIRATANNTTSVDNAAVGWRAIAP